MKARAGIGSPEAFVERGLGAFRRAMSGGRFGVTPEVMEAAEELTALWLRFYSTWPGRRVIGFSDPDEAVLKLIVDSFAMAMVRDLPGGRAIDLGSGNGWPGLARHALSPCEDLMLLDSRLGACEFMERFISTGGLKRVSVASERAETAIEEGTLAKGFSLVMSRAMAVPAVVLELAAAFPEVGGLVLLWLGPEEGKRLSRVRSVPELGLEADDMLWYELPEQGGKRLLAAFRKVAETQPGYPRKIPRMKFDPLV